MLKFLRVDQWDTPPEGIVFLDADGVITPNRSSWQVTRELLETEEQGKEHYKQFSNGEISFSDWGKKDALLWEGEPVSVLEARAESLETADGLCELVNYLHEIDFAVGVISTGILQLLEPTVIQSEMDFLAANELEVEDEYFTGHVEMKVTDSTKSDYVEEISDFYSVPLEKTVAVGDTRYDIEKFNSVGLSIAFNPAGEEIRQVADHIVNETDLLSIRPIICEWLESSSANIDRESNGTFQKPNS